MKRSLIFYSVVYTKNKRKAQCTNIRAPYPDSPDIHDVLRYLDFLSIHPRAFSQLTDILSQLIRSHIPHVQNDA